MKNSLFWPLDVFPSRLIIELNLLDNIKGEMCMEATTIPHLSSKNRCGSALIWLIIIAVVAVIIFGVRWYLKGPPKDPDLCDDLTPWQEWKIREASEQPPGELSKRQPALSKRLFFDTSARVQDETRGQIALIISPDGDVGGNWSGQYYKKPKINFDIMGGKFEGQVYPRKLYRDEKGEDPSKLYFIAKGQFVVAETNFDKGTVFHRGGDIYVRGWLNTDYSAAGTITITSDEKYSEQFDWKASRPQSK